MAATKNDVIKTMDPRLDLTRGSKMVLEEGARLVGLVKRTASQFDNTGVTFDNIDPGSPGFVIDRKMYARVGFEVVLRPRDAANGALLVLNSATDAVFRQSIDDLMSSLGISSFNGFRSFPIAQATRTLELLLNGESFNERLSDYVEPLMRFDNDYVRCKTDYSMSPALQDRAIDQRLYYNVQNPINIGVNPANPLNNAFIQDYNRYSANLNSNPLLSYGAVQNIDPRGSFIDRITPATRGILSNAFANQYPANATVDLGGAIIKFAASATANTSRVDTITLKFNGSSEIKITEPIMLPITSFGEPDCRGFYGVNDMRLSLVFSGSISDKVYQGVPAKFFISATANTGTRGFNTAVTNLELNPIVTVKSGDLYYNRLTPKITPELPLSNIYDDKRIKITDKNFTVAYPVDTATVSGTINFNNISVGTIPKRLYVFIQKTNKSYKDNDFYGVIDSFNFEFNNQNVQFSGADTEQLYLMSKRNGLLMEFKEWETKVGSIVCIDFARDVSLNDGDYPGRIGNYNFSFNLGYTVRRAITSASEFVVATGVLTFAAAEVNYTVRTVVLEEGYAIIQNQICSRVGGLIQIDPTSVPLRVMTNEQYWKNIYGGKFVDDLKHIAHKGLQYAEKALPYVEKGAKAAIKYAPEVAKGIASLLPMLAAGAGMSEKEAQRLIDTYGVDEFMSMYGSGVQSGKMSLKKKAKGGKMTSKSEMMKYM